MAEIYEIFTGNNYQPVSSKPKMGDRRIARSNDKFRKRIRTKTELSPSQGIMQLDRDTLGAVLHVLRNSTYDRIDFGSLSENFISTRFRSESERFHTAGLIHVGEPLCHVIWIVRQKVGKIELFLAEEYF